MKRKSRFLFIHQNFPGQFVHTAPAIAQLGHEVVALRIRKHASEKMVNWQGVQVLPYDLSGANVKGLHPWLTDIETKTLRATACWKACRQLKAAGWNPDVIVAHPGWGESLFVKSVWPSARLGLYAELYYQATGADSDFDPEFQSTPSDEVRNRLQMKNLNNLAHLSIADALLSPTRWQADSFPSPWRETITVVHDGVSTDSIKPDPGATLTLATSTQTLHRQDTVITYVARHLEPYRGFHVFMRALPELLRRLPSAQIIIVGDEAEGYGPLPANHATWRDLLTQEVQAGISAPDWQRIHFLGRVNRATFTKVLQLSTVHVYLSYPFVLSWSVLEAMSAGCAIVASDTAPVREVLEHGREGLLVDFFDKNALVESISQLTQDPSQRQRLGEAARQLATSRFDLRTVCLPAQLKWIQSLC